MFDNPTGRQILTFYMANEVYGMPVEYIKEISNLSPIHIQQQSEGRVQLRSREVPLFNLRSRLQLDSSFFPGSNSLVIISTDGLTFAVLVDGIDAVVRIPWTPARDAQHLPAPAHPYVAEVALHQQTAIRILDILACLGLRPQEERRLAAVS